MIQCHEDFVLHKSHFLFNLSSAYLGEHSNRIFSYLFQDVDGLKRVNLSCWAKEKRKKLLIIETLTFILQYWILDDETATVKSKFNFFFVFLDLDAIFLYLYSDLIITHLRFLLSEFVIFQLNKKFLFHSLETPKKHFFFYLNTNRRCRTSKNIWIFTLLGRERKNNRLRLLLMILLEKLLFFVKKTRKTFVSPF